MILTAFKMFWKAWDFMKGKWKLTAVVIGALFILSYIWGQKGQIAKQAEVILDREKAVAELTLLLERADHRIHVQNQGLLNLEKAYADAVKYAKRAENRAQKIQVQSLEKDRKLQALRIQSMSCDEALIKLGTALGEIQWRD